jgi:hypothetical protein
MPTWITALGVAGIGVMYGYLTFYALKRYLPPATKRPPRLRDLLLFLVTLGLGGAIGAPFLWIGGVSYVGPYGLGLLAGLVANIAVSVAVEVAYVRYLRRGR